MRLLISDLMSGYRALRRSPGMNALAILILALGIGATTAIFSVVYTVLLRPLPFPQDSRLMQLHESFPRLGWHEIPFSAPDFVYLRQHAKSFSALAAYRDKDVELSGRGRPERLHIARTTASLAAVLQVNPLLGRWFTAADDAGRKPVAVLSYGLWQRAFGGRRDVVGKMVELSRKGYTIVGVMPRRFEFPLRGGSFNNMPAALWIPISFTHQELTRYGDMFNNSVAGRLRAGVTAGQAEAESQALLRAFMRQYPAAIQSNPGFLLDGTVHPLREALTGRVRMLLWLLLGAAGLVLAIGCADVSSLLLTRAAARQPEMAMRAALGASRGQLMRQLLTEALVLALAGGGLGILVAEAGIRALTPAVASILPAGRQIAFDPAILGFALAVSLACTLLFGMAPAWQISGAHLAETLKQGGRGGGLGRRRHRLLSGLIAGQFALAALLLVAAGLLLRSFQRVLNTSPGFQPQQVITLGVSLPWRGYRQAAQIRNFYRQLLARAAALPGVKEAAATTVLPLNSVEHDVLHIRGRKLGRGPSPIVDVGVIEGDYFSTLRAPLLRGRSFGPADTAGAPLVAIVNQALARRFWPHQNPIGQQIRAMLAAKQWQTIVGVVSDIKNRSLDRGSAPQVYLPYDQIADKELISKLFGEFRTLHLVVRARSGAAGAAGLEAGLRGVVGGLDPSLPVFGVQTLAGEMRQTTQGRRLTLSLFGIFAGLALLLAAIGIYGVVAFSATQRTAEFGIRLALGALPGELLRLVLKQGLQLAAAGIAVGALAALASAKLLSSLLYGVTSRDPATYAAVMLLLVGIGLVAAGWPAWRASQTDALTALRYE